MTIQQHQPQTKVSVTANHSMSVPFRGDNLYLVECDGQPYVPMKLVVEGMGLDWKSQHVKLKSKFSKGMVEITIPSAGGNQNMTCLSLRKLPAWLYSVQPGKVSPEIREKVIAYQQECDEVLWQYWTTGTATKEQVKKQTSRAKALPGGLTVEQQTSIKALVKARVELLPPEKQAKAAITCWSALKSKFGMTYKQIDLDHFADAVSLVARIPLEGELMPKEIATPLEIHYPLDDWMMANARVMGTQMGQGACIPSSALIGGDAKSAINALLTELERHKYEVSACRAELRAMKHHLESYQLTLDDIADSAARIKRRIWREHH